MLRLLFLTAAAIYANATTAQCLSGNCTNGKGKYDFGWCSYEGEFKDGKPDGSGAMKYSDYTYNGHFSNGVEDGEGIIAYNDGRRESVQFVKGQKVDGPVKVAASDYKPVEGKDKGCISGDCNNGFGTYQFPSGNKYVGNFKEKAREGDGTFYFASGEQFSGAFHNNNYSNGTYTFATGATYTGTYDAQNNPVNGVVKAGSRSVPISNGKAIIPKEERYGYENTEATRKAAAASREPKKSAATFTWGSTQSDYDRSRESIEQSARNTQRMIDRMERPTYTHW